MPHNRDDADGEESERIQDLRDMLEETDSPGARELMEAYGSDETYERRKRRYLSAAGDGVTIRRL